MGKRGPLPTPTIILETRGSRLPKVQGRTTHEPRPKPGKPVRPQSVTGPAIKIWDALCKVLGELGVLAKSDAWQMERYCRYFVDWQNCQTALESMPRVASINNDKIRPILKGLRAERRELEGFLKNIEAHFGLTPASRARLIVEGGSGGQASGKSADPFAALLNRGKN